MKNKKFIVYNIVLFLIFVLISLFTLDGIPDLTDSQNLVLFIFGLSGILLQTFVINKKLSK